MPDPSKFRHINPVFKIKEDIEIVTIIPVKDNVVPNYEKEPRKDGRPWLDYIMPPIRTYVSPNHLFVATVIPFFTKMDEELYLAFRNYIHFQLDTDTLKQLDDAIFPGLTEKSNPTKCAIAVRILPSTQYYPVTLYVGKRYPIRDVNRDETYVLKPLKYWKREVILHYVDMQKAADAQKDEG